MERTTPPLLQLHLEATLRLLISLSPMLSPDEIGMARVRLVEADIIMGQLLSERDVTAITRTAQRANTANRHPAIPTTINHTPTSRTTTSQPAVSGNSSRSSQREVRRPVNHGIARNVNAAGPSTTRRVGDRPDLIIEVESDDD